MQLGKQYICALLNSLNNIVSHFYQTLPAQFSNFRETFLSEINKFNILDNVNKKEPPVDDPLNYAEIELCLKQQTKISVVNFINN